VKVKDFEMYYEDTGKGTPLVLIHGSPGNSTQWAAVIPEMSKEVRCVSMDLRGHGKSEKPDMPYTMEVLSDDVAALLDILKINKAYICGASAGGLVALKLALAHPEKVDGLILIDAACRLPAKSMQVSATLAKMRAEKGLQAYIDGELKVIFSPMFVRRHRDVLKKYSDSMQATDPNTAPRVTQGYMKSPPAMEKDLNKIKVPTLIIHGKEDEWIPVEEGELIHKGIQNSQIAVIPFSGHGVVLERPDYFTDLILYFIEESKKKHTS
jgi:pimeloyl-ACP methyl ester carboxylesterase